MSIGKLNKISKSYTSAMKDGSVAPKETDAMELEEMRKKLKKEDLLKGSEDESEEEETAMRNESCPRCKSKKA